MKQSEPRCGDYTVTRASDTPDQRMDAEATLRANGCRSFRHESLMDGRVLVHGYLTDEPQWAAIP